MRLADFILGNIEPILKEWESFARGMSPGAALDKRGLRDHAEQILRATARDMISFQSKMQQSEKSKGEGDASQASVRLDNASAVHGVDRVGAGFDLTEVVSEYRALRASILRLWRGSDLHPDVSDLDDVIRFNESIDQSLAKAVRSYTQRIDESRQMFLAILGHDLRGPLSAIAMSATLAVHPKLSDAECAEAVAQISSSTAVITGLVNDLLDFAGTGMGAAMPLSPVNMDLASLCREVVEEFRAAHPRCAVRFDSDGDVTGEWDASRLRQLISNLLGNAAQHGDETRGIDLSLTGKESEVLLSVANQGPSIPPEILATIFDPLVRGQSPSPAKQRRVGSIGLGLYIDREIAAAHGGTIRVTSTPAAGTCFTVHLPRRRVSLRTPEARSVATTPAPALVPAR